MKLICSYENTWNGNEDTCPHKVFPIKVHSSLFIIAKRWTPPKCYLHWRMNKGMGVPTRWNLSSAVKGTNRIRPRPCANLRSITVSGRASLKGLRVCDCTHSRSVTRGSHVLQSHCRHRLRECWAIAPRGIQGVVTASLWS